MKKMNDVEKAETIKDFLIWCKYNRSVYLMVMHEWALTDCGYKVEQDEVIKEYLEEEL